MTEDAAPTLLPYHAGERLAQARSGAEPPAGGLSRYVQTTINERWATRIASADLALVAVLDDSGAPRAWPFAGAPGFARVDSPTRLLVDAATAPAGWRAPTAGAPVGVLALDAARRLRARVNGTAAEPIDARTLAVDVAEAFGNCPKHIRPRTSRPAPAAVRDPVDRNGLTAAQRALLTASDTLFLATRSADGRLDASHRGGPPGFVAVEDDVIRFDDLQGNRMFQTLGNVLQDPRAVLVAIDYATSAWLEIAVHARVRWIAHAPGEDAIRRFEARVLGVTEHAPLARRWQPADAPSTEPAA